MFDGRTHLNSSHIETILSLLSIISFSNSVDELDDELNVKDEDEKDDLFLFSRLDLEFFLFSLMERFTDYLWVWWRGIYFPFLWRLSCLLVEEVFWFTNNLFAGSSYELSLALPFFRPASTLGLATGEMTFASCWSVCRGSVSFKLCDTIYCSLLNRVRCVSACQRGLGANVLARRCGLPVNVPNACHLLIFTCQRANKPANVSYGVPMF